MKIIHVHPEFFPVLFGGISKVAYDLSLELSKRGHDVTVLATDVQQKPDILINERVKIAPHLHVYYLKTLFGPLRHQKIFIPSPNTIRIIRAALTDADVIHIHSYRNPLNILVSRLAHQLGIPYIIQAHGTLPRVIAKQVLKFIYDVLFGKTFLDNASKLLALTRFEAQVFSDFGLPRDKISVIPNGIELSGYQNIPSPIDFKKKFGISPKKKIILYLGRFHKSKGIDLLVKAFAHLIKNPHLQGIMLVLIGPDDGYLDETHQLIDHFNLSENVLITGPLFNQEKLEAFASADIYALPSRYEAFPMTLLEAYACKKPVIAFNIGGIQDLVKNGVTGLLAEPGNILDLSKAFLTLLRDEEKAQTMGQNARRFLETNFTIQKVSEKLEELYLKLL